MLRPCWRAKPLRTCRRTFTTAQQHALKQYVAREEATDKLRALWHDFIHAQSAFNESTHEAAHANDPAVRELFDASLPSLQEEVASAKTAFTECILGPLLPGCTGVILEILAQRAGADGADFTAWLKRMYEGLAGKRKWRATELEADFCKITLPRPLAGGGEGYRHLVLQITGSEVWEHLRFERGVHRLTLMSAKGPVQSTDVRLMVFPIVESADGSSQRGSELLYHPSDLKIETMRSSGPGGQHVNKTESAVRITHRPTFISVSSQASRSQVDNKAEALRQLQARLLAVKLEEQEEAERIARQAAARQDRVRTYQFHKDRIIEHRLDKSDPLNFSRLSDFGNGSTLLPEVLKQLQEKDQNERLQRFLGSLK